MGTLDDITTYRNMLRINKHRLDDELEVQPDILDRIGQRVTVMNSRALEAADELKRHEANAYFSIKDADKLSETAIKEKVRIAPARLQAWGRLQAARSELEEWQGLYEAWKQRGYSLKELVSLYSAQYFTASPHSNVDRSERPAAPPRRVYTEADRSRLPAEPPAEVPRSRRRVE